MYIQISTNCSRLKLQYRLIYSFVVCGSSLFLFCLVLLLLFFINRAMITAAEYGETSWELSVQIDQKDGDESMKFKLRVKGDLHIGGLMLKLVEKISKCQKDIIIFCNVIFMCDGQHRCYTVIFFIISM